MMAEGAGGSAGGTSAGVNSGSTVAEVDAEAEANSRDRSEREGVEAVEGSSCTVVILLPEYSCLNATFKLFSVAPNGKPVTNSALLPPASAWDASSSSSV